MKIVHFKVEHATSMRIQVMQSECLNEFHKFNSELFADGAHRAVSLLTDEGEPQMCVGITMESGAWILWGLVAEGAGRRCMLQIVRICRRMVSLHDGWLYSVVRSDFPQAHRLIRMLGFRPMPNGHKPGILPGGLDADFYMRAC